MIDIRLRTRISDDELALKVGKILTDDDYNLIVTRDATIRRPDGVVMAVFRKGIVPPEVIDAAYPTLHELRKQTTQNRGLASGTRRIKGAFSSFANSKPISSALVGSFEKAGSMNYCRLTAWTGRETEKVAAMNPLLRFIGDRMRAEVPDRWAAQMEKVRETDPNWIIEGTPFSTVTVNNTYPTGVHTDKGDLDEGFSNLLVIRQGVEGGLLVFPRYRVAVQAATGDLLLMDAHEHHGNTRLWCASCCSELDRYHECGPGADPSTPGGRKHIAERISVVAYFRTKMVDCGTPADEAEKQRVIVDQRNAAAVGE